MNSIDLVTGRCWRCGSLVFSMGGGCPRCDALTCDTSGPVPPLPCQNCATERAAREKVERERDEALRHMSALSCTQGQDGLVAKVEALISDLVDTAFAQGIAEQEATTLRAELRQARRREAVLEFGLETDFVMRGVLVVGSTTSDAHQAYGRAGIIGKAYGSLREARDACANALHAAGLVEDGEGV